MPCGWLLNHEDANNCYMEVNLFTCVVNGLIESAYGAQGLITEGLVQMVQ